MKARKPAGPIKNLSRATCFLVASLATASAGEISDNQKRSAYDAMSAENRAMQDDDTSNPGMLWVLEGRTLWNKKEGAADRACADCHGDAAASMKGVATRLPEFDPKREKPVNVEQRINICRSEQQKATPLPGESRELLALATYVSRQSRGMPIQVKIDEQTQPFIAAGRELFQQRQGQLNLSCAICHDDLWGKRLAGALIPQGHPNGYPLYRLEWQSVGSLRRRLRNCMTGMRAEPYNASSDEFVNLELYLMQRARGLLIETPAVRP